MQKMTSRERVLNAVNHKETDRVPVDFGGVVSAVRWSAPYGYQALCDYLGIKDPEGEIFLATYSAHDVDPRIMDRFQVDIGHITMGGPEIEDLGNDLYRAPWGFIIRKYKSSDGSICTVFADELSPLKDITSAAEFRNYKYFPNPNDPALTKGKVEMAKYFRDQGRAVMAFAGWGPGHAYAWLRSFENYIYDLKTNPELFLECAEIIIEKQLETHRKFFSEVGEYVDIIEFDEDLGSQIAPLISPADYRKFIKPFHKHWVTEVKKIVPHVKVMLHSDGAIFKLIPDIIDCGFDILNPIQPMATGMDKAKLKAEFGKDICFLGGIDIQELLPFGTVPEIQEYVRNAVQTLAKGGGYILASSHNYGPEVKPENICAVFDTALNTPIPE